VSLYIEKAETSDDRQHPAGRPHQYPAASENVDVSDGISKFRLRTDRASASTVEANESRDILGYAIPATVC